MIYVVRQALEAHA